MRRFELLLALSAISVGCAGTQAKLAEGSASDSSRHAYCVDTRLALEGPVCIIKLTAEQQQGRSLSMRVEYDGKQIVRRERINGRGYAVPDADGCVEYRYRYENGRLAESTGHAVEGTVCQRTLYSEDLRTISLVDEWGHPSLAPDREHTSYVVERDARGFERVARHYAPDGKPARSASGAHELRVERDARGLETKVCHFDEHGKAMDTRFGPHCWLMKYDDFGNAIETRVLDKSGRPTVSYASAVYLTRLESDRFGNEAREAWFDIDGKPVAWRKVGCASIRHHYDAHGFRTGSDCEGPAGKPGKWRAGHSFWRSTPDRFGRAREERYFDEFGRLALKDPGYARIEMERDELGRLTKQRYFLPDGSPGQQDGPASERFVYAKDGTLAQRQSFDRDGKPFAKRGCAITQMAYDEFRRLVKETCLDEQGKPAKSWFGVAITSREYDERGLVAQMEYLDENGQAVAGPDGFSRVRYQYDRVGRELSRTHFRPDGSKLALARMRAIFVRPGYAERFWAPEDRAESLTRIEAARSSLLSGVPFEVVAARYGDERVDLKNPGDVGYTNTERVYTGLRLALSALEVGQYSEILEFPYAFAVYQRVE